MHSAIQCSHSPHLFSPLSRSAHFVSHEWMRDKWNVVQHTTPNADFLFSFVCVCSLPNGNGHIAWYCVYSLCAFVVAVVAVVAVFSCVQIRNWWNRRSSSAKRNKRWNTDRIDMNRMHRNSMESSRNLHFQSRVYHLHILTHTLEHIFASMTISLSILHRKIPIRQWDHFSPTTCVNDPMWCFSWWNGCARVRKEWTKVSTGR